MIKALNIGIAKLVEKFASKLTCWSTQDSTLTMMISIENNSFKVYSFSEKMTKISKDFQKVYMGIQSNIQSIIAWVYIIIVQPTQFNKSLSSLSVCKLDGGDLSFLKVLYDRAAYITYLYVTYVISSPKSIYNSPARYACSDKLNKNV